MKVDVSNCGITVGGWANSQEAGVCRGDVSTNFCASSKLSKITWIQAKERKANQNKIKHLKQTEVYL